MEFALSAIIVTVITRATGIKAFVRMIFPRSVYSNAITSNVIDAASAAKVATNPGVSDAIATIAMEISVTAMVNIRILRVRLIKDCSLSSGESNNLEKALSIHVLLLVLG